MRSRIAKGSLVLVFTSIILVSFVMVTQAGVPQATVVINDLSVPHGGTATVSIMITDATNNISSFELNLTYNTAVVALVNVTNSDFENFVWNEPTPGHVMMVGYQSGNSLIAPVKVADLTFLGVGYMGDTTPLTLEGDVYMGTIPFGNMTLGNGSATIIAGMPVLNPVGTVALVGLLALILVAATARIRKDE